MIEINKKEDIIIPFNKIGEEDWEVNTKLIIDSFAEIWENDPKELISADNIEKLEQRLKTTLPEALKCFYTTFGLADIGERLQDFQDIEWINDIWADAPQYGPDFTEEDKKILPYLVSFSDCLGNGDMFCFHSETKEIFFFNHDSKPYLTKMFNSVDEYLKGCLVFAQVDLFGEAEQKEVEEWTEAIVAEMYGSDIVKKWQY